MQEAVTLSTMPVWRDGRLEPRPFILRLFLGRLGDSWPVMPGGFVRIADNADARAVSLQRGGATADAWVLSEGPVGETHAAPDAGTHRHPAGGRRAAEPRRRQPVLGRRYVERAEATLRLVRALINRMTEADDAAAPMIARISALLGSLERQSRAILPGARRAWSRARRCCAATSRLAALARAGRARRSLRDPRPLLARCLARAQRSGRGDRRAAGRRPGRKP